MAQSLGGSIPSLDWESNDLPREWNNFQTHAEFMFAGPLKNKSEEEKCSFLMLWVGNKGLDIYGTLGLTAEQKNLCQHCVQSSKTMLNPNQTRFLHGINFSVLYKVKVTLVTNL